MAQRPSSRKLHLFNNLLKTVMLNLYYTTIGFLGSTWKECGQFTRFDELGLWYPWKRQCRWIYFVMKKYKI